MTPARSRTPIGGVPVVAPVAKHPSWRKVIAAVFGSAGGFGALVWVASSMFASRPTFAQVDDQIERSAVVQAKVDARALDDAFASHATRPHIQTDERLRTLEAHQAATDARLEWMVDVLKAQADRQGIRTRPVPRPGGE